MSHSQQDRTLALAGIYQSVILVQDVARKGSVSSAQITALLETLFRFDAASVMDVYGDLTTVRRGLNTLVEQLSGGGNAIDRELMQYGVNLLHLEKLLSKNPALMDKLADDLKIVHGKMDYFDVGHENIIAGLADIYQQDISPIGPKIMVQGEPEFLSQSSNAARIRALLLAGIRSAVLWRQCGGSRWQLIFSRKKYLNSARALLNGQGYNN